MRLMTEAGYEAALADVRCDRTRQIYGMISLLRNNLPRSSTTKLNLLANVLWMIDPNAEVNEAHPRRRAKREAAVENA